MRNYRLWSGADTSARESAFNLPYLRGDTFTAGLLWAMKNAADPAMREDGSPLLEIIDPLPPAYEAYRSILADYMEAHPGVKSYSPGFPQPPLIEAAA